MIVTEAKPGNTIPKGWHNRDHATYFNILESCYPFGVEDLYLVKTDSPIQINGKPMRMSDPPE